MFSGKVLEGAGAVVHPKLGFWRGVLCVADGV